MVRPLQALLLTSALAALSGCSTLKEYAPVTPAPVGAAVPNQQRLLSASAREAVGRATANMNLSAYRGKKARVEVVGVNVGKQELLDYVRVQVEAAAMQAGMIVLPPRYTAISVSAAAAADPPEEREDVRFVVALDWGGIDIKDHSYVKAWPLAGQILLPVVGIGGGALLASEDETVGITVMGATLVGSVVWWILGDSAGHTYTLTGRVRVQVLAAPLDPTLGGRQGTGEGESSIVIDPENDDGYTHIVPMPPRED